MREAYLDEVDKYRDIFVPHIQRLEDEGLCRFVANERTEHYFVEKTGAVFVLEKC